MFATFCVYFVYDFYTNNNNNKKSIGNKNDKARVADSVPFKQNLDDIKGPSTLLFRKTLKDFVRKKVVEFLDEYALITLHYITVI